MRVEPTPYWRAVAAVILVSAIGNVVVTNVFVALMTPHNWLERALPALGGALVLTMLTALFVVFATFWRRQALSPLWPVVLLAFAGAAAGWMILGAVFGGWLFPLYAFYGLGAAVVASVVIAVAAGRRPSRRRRPRR